MMARNAHLDPTTIRGCRGAADGSSDPSVEEQLVDDNELPSLVADQPVHA